MMSLLSMGDFLSGVSPAAATWAPALIMVSWWLMPKGALPTGDMWSLCSASILSSWALRVSEMKTVVSNWVWISEYVPPPRSDPH